MAALTIRLVVFAAGTTTGFALLKFSWQSAGLAVFGKSDLPLSRCDPDEQAKFWVSRGEAVSSVDDPQLLRGAAWMLNQPSFGFMARRLVPAPERNAQLRRMGISAPTVELDEERVCRETEEFEQAAGTLCLHLARRATELQPDDVESWRARRLLAFQGGVFGPTWKPRHEAWEDLFETARRHDPGNAVYDYIEASLKFDASIHQGLVDGPEDPEVAKQIYVTSVRSPELFDEAIRAMETGFRKPLLRFSNDHYRDGLRFCQWAGVPLLEQNEVAAKTGLSAQIVFLVRELIRRQVDRSTQMAQSGAVREAEAILRRSFRMVDQLESAHLHAYDECSSFVFRTVLAANLEQLATDYPGHTSNDLAAFTADQRARAERTQAETNARVQQFNELRRGNDSTLILVCVALAQHLPSFLCVGALAILGLQVILRWLPRPVEPVLFYWPLVRHATSLLIGVAAAFISLRLAISYLPRTGSVLSVIGDPLLLQDARKAAFANLSLSLTWRLDIVLIAAAASVQMIWTYIESRTSHPSVGYHAPPTRAISLGVAMRAGRNLLLTGCLIALTAHLAFMPSAIAIYEATYQLDRQMLLQ